MNIAICDDDIEFCTTLKRQLTDCLQYNDIIDIYYSGEMFLAGCKKCNYDAVFLDLYMVWMFIRDLMKFHRLTAIIFKIRTFVI